MRAGGGPSQSTQKLTVKGRVRRLPWGAWLAGYREAAWQHQPSGGPKPETTTRLRVVNTAESRCTPWARGLVPWAASGGHCPRVPRLWRGPAGHLHALLAGFGLCGTLLTDSPLVTRTWGPGRGSVQPVGTTCSRQAVPYPAGSRSCRPPGDLVRLDGQHG